VEEGGGRVSLGTSDLVFGAPDGLIPICGTDRGEEFFYAPRGALGQGSLFIEDGEGEFFEYSFSFAEWLYRWLTGEEVTGPGGSAFYPGCSERAVAFETLDQDLAPGLSIERNSHLDEPMVELGLESPEILNDA